MKKVFRVVLAPNEDGFGTSAWAVRLARELARQLADRALGIKVVVSTDRHRAFHQDKYRPDRPVEIVKLDGIRNRVELVKNRGGAEVAGSLERCVRSYGRSRAQYREALRRQAVLEGADLVVDLGVPQFVRAAHEGFQNTLTGPKEDATAVTVLDHAWSLSLEQMARHAELPDAVRQDVENGLSEIRTDESFTREAFFFPEPVSAPGVHAYWTRVLGRPARGIPAFLGGPLCTLEYVRDPSLPGLRSQMEVGARCPETACIKARRQARKLLGIRDEAPVLFVSGGGTGVWDRVLTGLLDDYLRREPAYNVVVYSPAEAGRRGVRLEKHGGVERAAWGEQGRIVFIDRVRGETHHVLFPAFDLVLTRAGGGTVNDGLACGAPMVLVEEPGMWQVEQIRRTCIGMGFARGVSLKEFLDRPRACVESTQGGLLLLEEERRRILDLPHHGEVPLVRVLLEKRRQAV